MKSKGLDFQRFLILPGVSIKNLASRTLALNVKRLSADWVATNSSWTTRPGSPGAFFGPVMERVSLAGHTFTHSLQLIHSMLSTRALPAQFLLTLRNLRNII